MAPRLPSSWWTFITQNESQQRYRLMQLAERYFCSEWMNTYPLRTATRTIWRWSCGPSCSCGSTLPVPPVPQPTQHYSLLSRRTTPPLHVARTHARGSGRTTGHTPCRIQGYSCVPTKLYQCRRQGLFWGRLGWSLRGGKGTFEDGAVVFGGQRVVVIGVCWSGGWGLSGGALGLVEQFGAFYYGEALGSFDDVDNEARTLGPGLTLRHDIYINGGMHPRRTSHLIYSDIHSSIWLVNTCIDPLWKRFNQGSCLLI